MTQKPHFSILATSFAGGWRPRHAALMLAGVWLVLFFGALFAPPVLDDADGTHAAAARAMATTGDLVTLRVDGVRYLEKAPLPYWLAALSFRIFGFNTFAAHLPQALAVLLLALLGHRWANHAFGSRTAFYTAIAILTAPGVFLFTRVLIPEVLLSLLLAASLYAFLKTVEPPTAVGVPIAFDVGDVNAERPALTWYAGPRFYAYTMWATLALAVLAKGLIALVFFFATVLIFLALTGELHKIRLLKPVTGGLLFLAIAAPWHVLAGLRNTGGMGGHGFFWFYFWNEHVLRFLGRRQPADYNRMPGYLYWLQHLAWLFPWTLFLPLGVAALWRRERHQTTVLTPYVTNLRGWRSFLALFLVIFFGSLFRDANHLDLFSYIVFLVAILSVIEITRRRRAAGLALSPFHRIDAQQRSILLLAIFAVVVLLFFSLSTNQEYYTFPAYLPLLLLIAATITRAEQTYSSSPSARRWITFAHAAFMAIGAMIAVALLYGLWSSRNLPYTADIGTLLAHRDVAGYTLSTAHFFDLTTQSFAALRLPAVLAAVVLLTGPAIAWTIRMQRRHLAATTAIAFTSAALLFAAQLAFARFAPMLSSRDFVLTLRQMEYDRTISRSSKVWLYGDQAFGSSMTFYLGEPVGLVNARSTSMLFGSTFADVPPVFLSDADLQAQWGRGERKLLFVPPDQRDRVNRLLGAKQFPLVETSGKQLITDRPLDTAAGADARP